ncbi:protein SPO16 homolog isoform X1 [Ranitomeya variabilis]|uniref:protein SPO16 homolog isoform X1 n=1 Tax=Ranitomeya variabilis TaxID=490064 RepID=UPI00405736B5
MAPPDAKLAEDWSTTVIVSNSLQEHEVIMSLRNQQHKIRFSESVLTGSIIFPLSGIAFLLADAQEILGSEREAVFEQIQEFTSIHRNSFLVIVAALHGQEERDLMFSIQLRFLGSNLKIIPAHNSMETVKSILTIAKATCKPHIESILDRLLQATVYIAENSPLWETLAKIGL